MKASRTQTRFSFLVDEVLGAIDENPTDHTISGVIEKHFASDTVDSHFYKDQLATELKSEIEGFGPILKMIEDPDITEICINSFDKIFFEKAGELNLHTSHFSSEITYERFVKYLLKMIDKTGDRRHPLVDGTLISKSDVGDSPHPLRIHVCLPPVTTRPKVTIRKHLAAKWNLKDLILQNMFGKPFYEKLVTWVSERKNILVCGPTNSGKTTLLRALLMECAQSSSERIISLEDTPELGSVGPQHVELLTRQDAEGLVPAIDLSTLLKNALRMRPDRLLVGEVRGTEALTLLDALSTGHRGGLCTLHANSAQHGLKRMESLILRASPQWNIQSVRQMIVDSLDVILVCKKANGLREISQAALLRGAEEFGYLLEDVKLL